MTHMGGLVHHQPLDLVEHGRVGHVAVAAIGSSGRDDADGRLLCLHVAHLDRGGVGTQHQARAIGALRQIEGIVHLAGRMAFRNVQGGEIVEIVLDIGTLGDLEPHLAENGDDLVDGLAHRMDASFDLRAGRQADIEALAREPGIERRLAQHGFAGLDRCGKHILELVQALARLAPGRRIECRQPLHQKGDFALLAQGLDADLLEGVGRLSRLSRRDPLFPHLVQILHRQIRQIKRGRLRRPRSDS